MPSASDERMLQPSAPTRFRHPLALLALLLLFAAKSDPANDRNLCKEAFLQIVSPDALSISADQCRAVARQTIAAWTFDANHMRWVDLSEMEKPLTLRLLSRDRMKEEHPGLLGFARGRNLFVVSTAVLDDSFANGTLAHELAHIQAKRALGKFSEAHRVPRYFIEGHGNSLGRSYRDHLRIPKHDYDVRKARQIMKFTADEARTILTDDSYGTTDKAAMDRMESMGIFFVEYLRLQHYPVGAPPNVVVGMARVFEAVGQGKTYESAFREQFGVSVEQVVSEIVALFGRTASHPAERIKGTRYAHFQ
jgi:hypothetical protein